MSTLLLFFLFAFMAVAIWLGYAGYRSMQKRRGPVPPPQTEEGAKPLSRQGAQPMEREEVRPEGEAGPKRPDDRAGPTQPTKRNSNEPNPPDKRHADDGA